MRIVTMADAQADLGRIADEVIAFGERVLIARDGGKHLVLISERELESIEATLELMADPEAQDRITEAEAAIASGETYTINDLRADMERRRSADGAGARSERDDDKTLTERVNRALELIGRDLSTDDAVAASHRYLSRTDDEW